MSEALAPVTSEALTPITSEAQALSWATKTGAARAAHSNVGAALAPKAARLGAAYQADLTKLGQGQYRAIVRDIVAGFTGQKLAGLRAHVAQAIGPVLATLPDGSQVTTGVNPVDLAPNKGLVLALATWLASPTAVKAAKGVTTATPFALTSAQATMAQSLVDWAKTQGAFGPVPQVAELPEAPL